MTRYSTSRFIRCPIPVSHSDRRREARLDMQPVCPLRADRGANTLGMRSLATQPQLRMDIIAAAKTAWLTSCALNRGIGAVDTMHPEVSCFLSKVQVIRHYFGEKKDQRTKAGTTKHPKEPVSKDFLRKPSCTSGLKIFENSGGSHASAHAHGYHAISTLAPF
jgi:hypothetical protein